MLHRISNPIHGSNSTILSSVGTPNIRGINSILGGWGGGGGSSGGCCYGGGVGGSGDGCYDGGGGSSGDGCFGIGGWGGLGARDIPLILGVSLLKCNYFTRMLINFINSFVENQHSEYYLKILFLFFPIVFNGRYVVQEILC